MERLWDRLRERFRPSGAEAALRDTIEEIIESGESDAPPIGQQERNLLRNIFKLGELTATDVMVPRADIVAAKQDVSLEALVLQITREAHSRLPIYGESLDDIVGFVHIKDVLPYWGSSKPFRIDDILRKVLFVAPSMRVLDLLLEMRRTRIHMALVVDEYGGIDGLVTIEDLVEEIVGEIEDEHDVEEAQHLIALPDGTWIADARLPIDSFESQVGALLSDEERASDIATLGGAVVQRAGRVPARGEIVTGDGRFEFEVLDADPRRLKRLKVRRVAGAETAEGDGPPETA
jgi:CBS domain containing-hemolysin-like protein